MRIKDLVRNLNAAVKLVDFSKIHTHNEFHQKVLSFVLGYDLPARFIITTWEIEYVIGRGDGQRKHPVISYRRDFEKYKYCKWSDRGNFSKVWFESVAGLEDVEIELLDKHFADEANRNSIAYYEKVIKESKEDIDEAEKKLVELRKHK